MVAKEKKSVPVPTPARVSRTFRTGHRVGKSFLSPEQELLQTVYNNCAKMLKSHKKQTQESMFEALTGRPARTVQKQIRKTPKGGKPPAPKRKGPKQLFLDEKFEFFYDWIAEKIENAKKGKFLTLRSIKRALKLEHDVTVSLVVLRRSLKKMGFQYGKREGKWTSRRLEPHIVLRLQDHCKWVVENSERKVREDGKFQYSWVRHVAFQDESWLIERQFRAASWNKKGDKTLDVEGGGGARLNMLHTIFSNHDPQPMSTKTKRPEALVVYRSTWTSDKHEWAGRTTDAKMVNEYFEKKVFVNLGEGGVAFADNASTHREYAQKLEEMSETELIGLICDKLNISSNSKAEKKRLAKAKGKYSNFRWKAANAFMELPYEAKKEDYAKFIREWRLFDTKLYQMAQLYEQNMRYLPQYYPESNPIERWWSLFKRYYYDTDPGMDWQKRLDEALSRIPDDYVHKCIHKSLEWCWQKSGWQTSGAARLRGKEPGKGEWG